MDNSRLPTRRLRIFLRDFRVVEAEAGFSDGQTLATYFGNRRTYINLRGSWWEGTRERIDHAMLRVDQVLWATAVDGDVALSTASGPVRRVEMQLDGGMRVRGGLLMSARQRVSDALEAAGQFIPLTNSQLMKSGRPPKEVNVELGDIVVNQYAIQAMWELEVPAPLKRARRSVWRELQSDPTDETGAF